MHWLWPVESRHVLLARLIRESIPPRFEALDDVIAVSSDLIACRECALGWRNVGVLHGVIHTFGGGFEKSFADAEHVV